MLSDVDRDPSEIFRKTTMFEFPFTSQKALELSEWKTIIDWRLTGLNDIHPRNMF